MVKMFHCFLTQVVKMFSELFVVYIHTNFDIQINLLSCIVLMLFCNVSNYSSNIAQLIINKCTKLSSQQKKKAQYKFGATQLIPTSYHTTMCNGLCYMPGLPEGMATI